MGIEGELSPRPLLRSRVDPEVVTAFTELRRLIDQSGHSRMKVADRVGISASALSKLLHPEKYQAKRDWAVIEEILWAAGQGSLTFTEDYGYLWGVKRTKTAPAESTGCVPSATGSDHGQENEGPGTIGLGASAANSGGYFVYFLVLVGLAVAVIVFGVMVAESAGPGKGPSALPLPSPSRPPPSPSSSKPRFTPPPTVDPALLDPVQLSSIAVYDPSGSPDNPDDVNRSVDNDPDTSWRTSTYRAQLGSGQGKSGIGMMTTLTVPREVTEITVYAPRSDGTQIEVRDAPAPDVPLSRTVILGTGTVVHEHAVITLAPAAATNNLLIWITALGGPGPYQTNMAEVVLLAMK